MRGCDLYQMELRLTKESLDFPEDSPRNSLVFPALSGKGVHMQQVLPNPYMLKDPLEKSGLELFNIFLKVNLE